MKKETFFKRYRKQFQMLACALLLAGSVFKWILFAQRGRGMDAIVGFIFGIVFLFNAYDLYILLKKKVTGRELELI